MKTRRNRNLLFVAAAAFVVAATTIAVVVAANRDGTDSQTGKGASVAVARRIMTPVAIDQGKANAARDGVVANVTSAGRGRVIVQVATNLSPNASAQDEVRAVAASQDNVLASTAGSVNVVGKLTRIPILVLEVDETAIRSLAASSGVVALMMDTPREITVSESIPMIGAQVVYSSGYTGKGFSVAILDSGVEATHSFFGGRVVYDGCFSSNYSADNIESLCPNGGDFQEGPGASNGCPIGLDGCDHGSHVAGIAAGNASGGNGVAPGAGIVGLQVFSRFAADRCGGTADCIRTLDSDQMRAMEWVLENRDRYNIAAINMSLGGGSYTDQATCDAESAPYKAVVDRLVAANIAVVSTTGNNAETNAMGSPGCISSIISVGSVTKSDGISDFSNSHAMMDILAPGSDIISAYKGNRFDAMSGTSMAAPHVAGAFALLRSARPNASISQIFAAMAEGGNSFRDPRNGLVRPRLEVGNALRILAGGSLPQPTPGPRVQPRPAPVQGPANDEQGNATIISGASFRDVIDVRNATIGDEFPIEPTWYCQDGGLYDKSVWYSFNAPSDGYLTVTTEGSDYDTIVSVWQGQASDPFQIGCNDDDAWPDVQTTTIAGWVAAGTNFRIQVAAWDNGGTLVFNAYFQSSRAASSYTNPNVAPVVFDAALSEIPSDLAAARATTSGASPAACGVKGQRPAGLKGECFSGLAPR